jgi:hypothetical protein
MGYNGPPDDFRATLPAGAAPDLDLTCIKALLSKIVASARELERGEEWSFAESDWRFARNISGRYQKDYDRISRRLNRAEEKHRREEAAAAEREEKAANSRATMGAVIGAFMRANGFDGAVVGATGTDKKTLLIQHDDLSRDVISGLAAEGLFDVASQYGFAEIRATNGNLIGHKSWTFRVQ